LIFFLDLDGVSNGYIVTGLSYFFLLIWVFKLVCIYFD
jgi:hypothetical protein